MGQWYPSGASLFFGPLAGELPAGQADVGIVGDDYQEVRLVTGDVDGDGVLDVGIQRIYDNTLLIFSGKRLIE